MKNRLEQLKENLEFWQNTLSYEKEQVEFWKQNVV